MRRIAAIAVMVSLTFGSASAQDAIDTYPIRDFGIVPRPASKTVLLDLEPIQNELKLTDAQIQAPAKVFERFQGKIQGVREIADDEKRSAAIQTLQSEIEAATIERLSEAQKERLDQIQLQLQGPIAFRLPRFQKRLGLSGGQVKEILPIVDEGEAEIRKAAVVLLPAPLKLEDKAESLAVLRKQVEAPEFQAAIAKARREARDAWDSSVRRIADVLTEPQRREYATRLGPRFDATTLRADDKQDAVMFLASRAGMGGQRADPDFNTKVERPAYTETHPVVVIDEAHHNFHTAGGRYKPFAGLLAGDGYRVIPGKTPFTRAALDAGNVLVVANALGAQGMGSPGAAQPAFTDEECEAVRRWVEDGGSLLLISDHPPMGSAAAGLSKQFGVVMSQGVAVDPKNSADGPAQLVFSRENALLGDHPITRGREDSERIKKVMTFAGQSLSGGKGSVSFLVLGESATDKAVSVAGHSQGLALRYGKGRVVVLGEAGQLSAQILGPTREPMGMNVPGIDNRQLALNIMHWLSGLLDPGGN